VLPITRIVENSFSEEIARKNEFERGLRQAATPEEPRYNRKQILTNVIETFNQISFKGKKRSAFKYYFSTLMQQVEKFGFKKASFK